MSRGLVSGADERNVLLILCLDIAKIIPCFLGLLRAEQEVEYSHRLDFCACCYAFVRNRSGHRDGVCPMMTRQSGNIRGISKSHRRDVPGNIADVIGCSALRLANRLPELSEFHCEPGGWRF